MKKFNFQLASIYLVYFSTLGLKQTVCISPLSSAPCIRIPKSANMESRFQKFMTNIFAHFKNEQKDMLNTQLTISQ